MDTSTSTVTEVVRTTAEKVAILRGTQKVFCKELTVEDWAELIDQLIRDYSPCLKYLHLFTTVGDHVLKFRPGAKVTKSVQDSIRITPVYQWQRSWECIELELFLDRDGCFVIKSFTCVLDSSSKSPKMNYRYELDNVLSMVRFLKHQSELGAFLDVALGREIVMGLFRMFDRTVKHKAQTLQNLETARDHVKGLLCRGKY